jgi:mRNA interferase MazF
VRGAEAKVRLPARRCGLPHASKAQAEQVRAVAVDRIGAVIGRLPPDLLAGLDNALRLNLAL